MGQPVYFNLCIAEGTNVEEAANFLVQKIIDNEKWRSHQQLTNGHDVRDGGGEGPGRCCSQALVDRFCRGV